MPIVDVLIVEGGASADACAASDLADALGRVFGAPPGRVWVRVARLPRADYAENGVAGVDAPVPVFVTVLHAQPPEGAARAAEARTVTAAVAEVCGRPVDCVHVEYAAAGRARVAFGGTLVD